MRKRLIGALAAASAVAVTAGTPVAAAGGQKQAEIVVRGGRRQRGRPRHARRPVSHR